MADLRKGDIAAQVAGKLGGSKVEGERALKAVWTPYTNRWPMVKRWFSPVSGRSPSEKSRLGRSSPFEVGRQVS